MNRFILLSATLIVGCSQTTSKTTEEAASTLDEETNSNTEESNNNSSEDLPEDQPEDNSDPMTDDYTNPNFATGVTTLAGSGDFSSVDGVGLSASFAEPKSLTMRPDGTLIVVDSNTGSIREVSLDGTVTTMSFNGPKPTAPSGVVADAYGSLYISDYEEHCIYKIQNNNSHVFAGSCGTSGFQDGTNALFNLPRGMDFDHDGNLIVADAHNFRIRSISPSGEVRTIAGSGAEFVGPSEGSTETANIYLPFGIAVHESGDIYFSGFDHCIRRIHEGQVEDIAGLCRNYLNEGTEDGLPTEARFSHPLDITFAPDNSLIIADCFNDRIRVLSADFSSVTTLSGSATGYLDGSLEEALFEIPRGVTVDRFGNIYVADSINMRIRVVTP
ncbi:MAG: hypothetical protein CMK59_09785 [Proteobacteria bacterium]|nr:hypothetical protein [Pseudomonadota bacterium]